MSKVQLMRELEGASEAFATHSLWLIAAQVLDFLLFLKQRHSNPNQTSQAQQTVLEHQTSQAQQTVLERMGGVPKYLLSDGRLSDRKNRRAIISERIRQRYQKEI
ncbi:MAG: hypothetical protein AB4042_19495 [Leptolyngbyaceae cyanobacterium]